MSLDSDNFLFKPCMFKRLIETTTKFRDQEVSAIRRSYISPNKTNKSCNKTHNCVNLGVFPGISSCKHQEIDMVKS